MSSIPQKMKAVILTEGGAKPQVATIPVPQPGAGEVLVKMHASPINPSDLAFLEGGYGIKKQYLGYANIIFTKMALAIIDKEKLSGVFKPVNRLNAAWHDNYCSKIFK